MIYSFRFTRVNLVISIPLQGSPLYLHVSVKGNIFIHSIFGHAINNYSIFGLAINNHSIFGLAEISTIYYVVSFSCNSEEKVSELLENSEKRITVVVGRS